ncbi:NIPSNAP family protein [Paraburkholderia sp. D15]|uniref:NIPSNAP family protein n=1 Tax=Paraburkholderia sp. D15 TaxID=2880218 RepID=UPI00247A3BAF|nr:NIPSNAP family protein [Paraburkholderia sp. D15]WGS53770.1 NIPSNAP family protein [Paraburkholderia sp. D15]
MNESTYDKQPGIVELRQYTLHSHKRDVLIDLFDRELVETQEEVGMTVIGQFRDLDNPDRFVWLRGFEDMEARHAGLTAFYDGSVWQRHASTANATMIDSDNVLLLRPAWPGAQLPMNPARRAGHGATAIPSGFVDVTIYYLKEPASEQLLRFCRECVSGVFDRGGVCAQGWYITEPSENDFCRLPVRTDGDVLISIALFPDMASYDAFGRSSLWVQEVAPRMAWWPMRFIEKYRLVPTARSAIHA